MVTKAKYEISAKDKTQKAHKSARKRLEGLGKQVAILAGAAGFGLLTKALITQINTYDNLSNRLKLVTKGEEELLKVQTSLYEVAQDTRGSLEGTIDLYTRFARSTKKLSLSQEDLANITKTVNQTLIISGSSTQAANAAVIQLGQGLASGVIRGQELNSILEQTPRLAAAIADGMGVATGDLKKLGEQGKITSKAVVDALKNQAGAVGLEFGKMNKTIAQAFVQIENEFLKTFGSVESGGLVESLDDFREIISDPDVAKGLTAIATGLISIASAATSVIGNLAATGTAIGEFAAGEIGTQLERINEKIGETQSKITAANFQIARAQGNVTVKTIRATESLTLLNAELKINLDIKRAILQQTIVGAETEERLNAALTKQTQTSGSIFGTDGENPSIQTLEQYADGLNAERELQQNHDFNMAVMADIAQAEAMNKLRKNSQEEIAILKDKLLTTSSIFSSLSILQKGEGEKRNRESRELAKVAIGISTGVAVMNALETKPFFPTGLAMSLKAFAIAKKQLAAIGAPSSNVTITPSLPSQQQNNTPNNNSFGSPTPPQQVTNIIISGTDGRSNEDIIDAIRDAINNNDIKIMDPDSLQAQEIREAI